VWNQWFGYDSKLSKSVLKKDQLMLGTMLDIDIEVMLQILISFDASLLRDKHLRVGDQRLLTIIKL
jgi:hypothetical protein